MKIIQVEKYTCELCGHTYDEREQALGCEARPITQDRGVKVGDLVTITAGDGQGHQARVTEIFVLNREWGHYQWERYWHTVGLFARIVDDWGSRMLTFDSYTVEADA